MWSDSSKTLNENRKVYYQNAKLWVQLFNLTNDSLKTFNKPLFTPTVVMEIGLKRYLFVLNKAKINRKGHVVFKVSTKEIKTSDKKLLKLPRGHHDRVRFDIDNNAGGGVCDGVVVVTPVPQDTTTLFKKNWTKGPTEWILYNDNGTCAYVVALMGQTSPCSVKSTEVTNLVNSFGLSSGILAYEDGYYTGVYMSKL